MRYLTIVLRLMIWFLLTADLSLTNILIGLAIALVLPHGPRGTATLKDWAMSLGKVILAIPIAYAEAIELIFRPHLYEEMTLEQVPPRRTPGLIFLDIFRITFTPKTVVLSYDKKGWYTIHRVSPRRKRP
ncbi:cation:proton antiporter [Candidatus Synechococcus calcipolaris G9]|uniref:Cation:proton antiporter n=1 Tax=Candidatus Synechococcus calcipolaris G9 TaxID=1497997 RepID=A0ABT6EYE2_9SYNE|nr:cation:proton antiporter [Candidatus Synechococcus calcipolaris]MDG2990514.1 cation:proton antiporter [Candidatus Synechococcus calcipolaris G9]